MVSHATGRCNPTQPMLRLAVTQHLRFSAQAFCRKLCRSCSCSCSCSCSHAAPRNAERHSSAHCRIAEGWHVSNLLGGGARCRPVTGTIDFTQVFRVLADNQSMPMDWQRVEDHQGHATQDAEQDALRKERRTFASNPSPSLFADPWFPSNSFNRSFNVVPVSLPGSSEVKRGKTNQSEVLFFLSLSPWLSALSITPVLPPRTPQHRATQFLVMPRSF